MYSQYSIQIGAAVLIAGVIVGAGAMYLIDRQKKVAGSKDAKPTPPLFWPILISSFVTAFIVANVVHWYHMHWLLVIKERFGSF